jgi:hypothetical protein
MPDVNHRPEMVGFGAKIGALFRREGHSDIGCWLPVEGSLSYCDLLVVLLETTLPVEWNRFLDGQQRTERTSRTTA